MLFPSKLLIADFFRLGQVELAEQFVVAVRELARFPAHAIEPEQVANLRGRGEKINQLRSVGRRAKSHDGLVPFRDFRDRAGRDIERAEIRLPFLREIFDDALAVRRPDRNVAATAAGRSLVPEHARADIPVESGGEISRLRVFDQIDHPQIGLGVGIDRLLRRRDERDLFSIRAERKAARVHVDRRQFRGLSATRRDGIKFRLRPLVVRLVVMERREINLRAIFRPNERRPRRNGRSSVASAAPSRRRSAAPARPRCAAAV